MHRDPLASSSRRDVATAPSHPLPLYSRRIHQLSSTAHPWPFATSCVSMKIDEVDHLFDALSHIEPSIWNWHEMALCQAIGMKKPAESSSTHKDLKELLNAIDNVDRRGVGDKRAGTKQQPSLLLTLPDIGIKYVHHGKAEKFRAPELSSGGKNSSRHTMAIPRWFQIGTDTVAVKQQLKLIRHITGDDGRLAQDVQMRRKKAWPDWAIGNRHSEDVKAFEAHDLPEIIHHFWYDIHGDDDDDESKPESAAGISRRRILSISLSLKVMLKMSNCFPSKGTCATGFITSAAADSAYSTPDKGKRSAEELDKEDSAGISSKKHCTGVSWPNLDDTTDAGTPLSFCISALRSKVATEGLGAVIDIGQYEYAVLGLDADKSRHHRVYKMYDEVRRSAGGGQRRRGPFAPSSSWCFVKNGKFFSLLHARSTHVSFVEFAKRPTVAS